MRPSVQRTLGIVLVAVLLLQLVGLSVVSAAPAAAWGPGPGPGQVHFVRPGETLFAIGRLYGVNPWAIARENCLPNPHLIFVGQPLVIPMGPLPMMPPQPMPMSYGPGYGGGFGPGCCGMFHTVRAGETLFAIGRLYGVNPWGIARINNLMNPHLIFSGQVLCIPGTGPAPFVM